MDGRVGLSDTRPLDTQTGRALDMIADMSAAQWINFGQWCARWAQAFAALDHRTRTTPMQRTPQRTAAQPQRTPQRTASGRRRKRGKTPAYRKNMRAADILAAHFADGRNEGDLYIPARQLADKLGIGSTTANDYQVRMRGYLDDGGED